MKKIPVATIAACIAFQLLPAQGAEKRVYLIGNSLTDNVKYEGLQKLAESRGHKHVWGRSMTPGAPISWHWEHDPAFTQGPFGPYRKALVEYEWDAVTFQPFSSYGKEFGAIQKFVELTGPKNGQAQLYVYAQWPVKGNGDFDAQFTEEAKSEESMVSSRGIPFYYEKFVTELRKACPGMKPPLLIPAGHAMYILNQKIKAGQAPGLRSIWDLYNDGVHLSNVGAYIAGLSFYAVIYQDSPVGLTAEPYQAAHGRKDMAIGPDLAKVLQECVWEAVTANPLTGVTSAEPVKIVTPTLPEAVVGKPAKIDLLAGLGAPPYKWELKSGKLPAGIQLEPSGVIAGTATATGSFPVTLAATDAKGGKAARDLKLEVVADKKPAVAESALTQGRVGQFYLHELKADGGNGPLVWRLKKGQKLPPGLALDAEGIVRGTPVKEGAFTFGVEVEDADRIPDVSAKDLTLDVAAPGPDVVMVRRVEPKSIKADGILDEPVWQLDKKIAKVVDGKAGAAKAVFDVVTDGDALYVAVKVTDPAIVENADEPWAGDSVELFIDAQNNRETVYNFDDRRVTVAPSGKSKIVGNTATLGRQAKKTEDGYAVEFQVYAYNLGISLGDTAIGLDVGLNDYDSGGKVCQMVWRGTKDNATVPNSFATVVLPPKPGK